MKIVPYCKLDGHPRDTEKLWKGANKHSELNLSVGIHSLHKNCFDPIHFLQDISSSTKTYCFACLLIKVFNYVKSLLTCKLPGYLKTQRTGVQATAKGKGALSCTLTGFPQNKQEQWAEKKRMGFQWWDYFSCGHPEGKVAHLNMQSLPWRGLKITSSKADQPHCSPDWPYYATHLQPPLWPNFEVQPHHGQDFWPWASYFAALSFGFLVGEIRIIM